MSHNLEEILIINHEDAAKMEGMNGYRHGYMKACRTIASQMGLKMNLGGFEINGEPSE